MATGNTTNRITLKIGVLLDDKMAIAQGEKIRQRFDGDLAGTMKKQTKEMQNQQRALAGTTDEVKKQKTFLGELRGGWDKTLANFAKFSVMTGILMAVTVSMKQMKDLIFELDTAMTNLSIVTNANASELAMVDKRATELTTTLGALKGEVINSITEFARAGYDLADSMLLAEKATMAANVGFTELDKITTFLIAGLKSFKLEAEGATRMMDVLFRVANVTAIDLEGIGEAFLRSANTLKVSGATLEESASLIAAANESIQDPAKVGTALKTIASRLRGVGDEGEVVATLADDFRRVGVEIQNADGSFRNIYDVFEDFSVVYKTLDDLTKESLLEKLAGKRQKNIMIGLLENFDLAQMALEEAMNSAGAVAEANEKYIDSLEGKTKILTETWGEFLRQLGDSAAYKAGIDALTGLLKLLTMMTNGFGGLITGASLLAVGLSALSPLIVGTVTLATGGLSLILPILATVVGAFLGYSSIVELTTDNTEKLSAATKKLTEAQKENANVVQNGTIKQQKELADQLQEVINKIEEANRAYQKSMSSQSGSDTISGSIRDITGATNEYKMSVAQLEDELGKLGFTQQEARDFISQTRVATEGMSQALIDMAEAVFTVKQLVSSSSKDYQILSDALYDLETQGYLSDDMLNTLIETYPDLIKVTGLQTDAVRDYAAQERLSVGQVIADSKKLLNAKIVEAEQVLKLNQAKLDSVMALTKQENQYYSVVEAVRDYSKNIADSNKVIQDARNSLALLGNETKQLESIDKTRSENLIKYNKDKEESTAKTTAQKESLTNLERTLRDVNQAIAVQQKLYARTDDVQEQIRINDVLIGLYKDQKVAIENVRAEFIEKNKNLKQGTAEYDDYIDQLYKFSLQVEDATNNIFSLTKSNISLANSLDEVKKKASESDLKDLTSEITNFVKDQIKNIKNLKEIRDKYYDSAIEKAQQDIDNFKKTNDEISDQIKLQQMLLDLQTLRERRQNIIDNKNVRLVRDSEVGFEWVADPRELRKAEEDIANAEQSIAEFRRSMSEKAELERLEAVKSAIEQERKLEFEGYDQRIKDWELFDSALSDAISSGAEITNELLKGIMSKYGEIEQTSYNERLSSLDGFISTYNAKLAEVNRLAADISAREQTIKNIIPTPNSVLGTGVSSTSGKVQSTAPSTGSIAKKVTPISAQSTSNQTNINNLNINSGRDSVDAIIKDANAQAKIMKY